MEIKIKQYSSNYQIWIYFNDESREDFYASMTLEGIEDYTVKQNVESDLDSIIDMIKTKLTVDEKEDLRYKIEQHVYSCLNCEVDEIELKSTINSMEIKKEIEGAAQEHFENYLIKNNRIESFYEHGQWWVRFEVGFEIDEEAEDRIFRTFSVVDAEGIGTVDGYDFEEV